MLGWALEVSNKNLGLQTLQVPLPNSMSFLSFNSNLQLKPAANVCCKDCFSYKWATNKTRGPLLSMGHPGCFIGILVMVYHNPWGNIIVYTLKTSKNQGRCFHCSNKHGPCSNHRSSCSSFLLSRYLANMKLPGLSRSGGLSHVCFFFILFMLSCKLKSFWNSGHSTKPKTTCCNSCEIMERPRAFFCWENWRLPAAEEPWRVAKSTALYPFYLYTPLMHTCGMFPIFVFGIHVSLSTLQSSKLSILLTMMNIMKLMTRMNRIIIIIIIITTDHPYKPLRWPGRCDHQRGAVFRWWWLCYPPGCHERKYP